MNQKHQEKGATLFNISPLLSISTCVDFWKEWKEVLTYRNGLWKQFLHDTVYNTVMTEMRDEHPQKVYWSILVTEERVYWWGWVMNILEKQTVLSQLWRRVYWWRWVIWCSSLISVSIPCSVTEIGEGAFYECSSLNFITIHNNAFEGHHLVMQGWNNQKNRTRLDTTCHIPSSNGWYI